MDKQIKQLKINWEQTELDYFKSKQYEFKHKFGVDLYRVLELISNHVTAQGEIIYPKKIAWDVDVVNWYECANYYNLETLTCLQTSIGLDENEELYLPQCIISLTPILRSFSDDEADKFKRLLYFTFCFTTNNLALTILSLIPPTDEETKKVRRILENHFRHHPDRLHLARMLGMKNVYNHEKL